MDNGVNNNRADSGLLVSDPAFVHELVEGLVGVLAVVHVLCAVLAVGAAGSF
jgi:hypothetical protein